MFRHSLAAAVLSLLPLAVAADTIGSITATLGDGGEKTWHATADGGESQSFFVQIMPGSLNGASFSVWGNPSEGDLAATSDVLTVSATLMRGPGGFIAIPTLEYLEQGYSAFWSSVEDDPVEMTLETVEAEGEALRVSGSFSGRVYFSDDAAQPGRDRDRMRAVAGRFEAVLDAQ